MAFSILGYLAGRILHATLSAVKSKVLHFIWSVPYLPLRKCGPLLVRALSKSGFVSSSEEILTLKGHLNIDGFGIVSLYKVALKKLKIVRLVNNAFLSLPFL